MDASSLRIDRLEVVQLESVDSTNGYLQRVANSVNKPIVAIANGQSAGRGQQGTHWDSLPGDATFSILLEPKELPAGRTFLLSQLLSLALRDVLSELGVDAEVKWPNDILVQRRKVCGVLIETHLQGAYVRNAILGAGMNLAVRPLGFPNYPTPAATLADWVYVESLPAPLSFVQMLVAAWNACLERTEGDMENSIQRSYLASLFNGVGFHDFEDGDGAFRAEIAGVRPTGELVLRRGNGTQRVYPFKGVRQKMF